MYLPDLFLNVRYNFDILDLYISPLLQTSQTKVVLTLFFKDTGWRTSGPQLPYSQKPFSAEQVFYGRKFTPLSLAFVIEMFPLAHGIRHTYLYASILLDCPTSSFIFIKFILMISDKKMNPFLYDNYNRCLYEKKKCNMVCK